MPAGAAGFAGVAVGAGAAGLGEEAAVFLYREPAQVRGAFPRAAWPGGGALVRVAGQGLVGSEAACRAAGPGAAALATHRVSSALVVCETGAEEPGSAEVLVTVGSWEEPVSVSLSSPGAVSGVAPAQGPAGGGTALELQGAGVGDSKALHCSVGAVAPVAARWADAQTVECEAPAHAPGSAAVGLGVSGQLRARGAEFTFTEAGAGEEPEREPQEAAPSGGGLERAAAVEEALAAAAVPRVTRVRPASGPAGGGTPVYVAGEGLHGGLVCSFGTVSRVAGRWASGSGVECVSPARAPGAVGLELEAEAGAGAVSVRSQDGERFTYVPEARVESVQPASGPTRGGTQVSMYGHDYNAAGGMQFWVSGSPFKVHVVSSQEAASSTPPGRPGFAGLTLGGYSTGPTEEAAVFLYREPAQVRGAFPRAAWPGGGALVRVAGPGAAALATHRVSSALVVCETGAEEPGSAEVLVTVGSWEEPVSVSLSSPGAVSGVAPAQGPAGGGTALELQGAG